MIETVAAQVPGNAGRSLLELHAGGELNADFGNWYVPTVEALCALVRASGFAPGRRGARPAAGCVALSVASRAACTCSPSRPIPRPTNYRAVVHART